MTTSEALKIRGQIRAIKARAERSRFEADRIVARRQIAALLAKLEG